MLEVGYCSRTDEPHHLHMKTDEGLEGKLACLPEVGRPTSLLVDLASNLLDAVKLSWFHYLGKLASAIFGREKPEVCVSTFQL